MATLTILRGMATLTKLRGMATLTILQGTRGNGKTTLIRAIAEAHPQAVGVYAEKCFDTQGGVDGYDAVLLPGRRRLPLCRRAQGGGFTARHGGFWFDESVFGQVEAWVRANLRPGSLVLIDEVGHLELRHHRGHFPLLEYVASQPVGDIIITLRGKNM